jgi:dihydropyrimidinase
MSDHEYDTVVAGGLVVTPDGERHLDIGIRGERIAALGAGLAGRAREVIDAAGRVVLPGVIDAHVHCQTWSDHADEIEDSHRSAAYGGVTSVITQIRARAEMAPRHAIGLFIERGEAGSPVDFGLHTILRPEHDLATAIPDVVALGSPSVKFFMAYKNAGLMMPDRRLLEGFEIARDHGCLAMVHAEDGDMIDFLIERAVAAGRRDLAALAEAQPSASEDLGTARALAYAAAVGCAVYVLHMTTAGSVRALRAAQAAGHRAVGESCPKYLTMTNDDMLRLGPVAKVGPPLRTAADHEALWQGLADQTVRVIASDHAPKVRRNLTATDDVFAEPYGAPGVETLLPVSYDAMINQRRGSLLDLARALSENPARIYGLYPRKGVIAVGSDADLVIIDPAVSRTIRAAEQHTTATYSLYEGREVTGWPVRSLLRGRTLLAGDQLADGHPRGRYLPRRPEDLLRLDDAGPAA